MVSRSEFDDPKVEAAWRLLGEVFRILGEYRGLMVLVGGWVPGLLTSDAPERHGGSLDVDIALDHAKIDGDFYERIAEVLAKHGFRRKENSRFSFLRTVAVDGDAFEVQLDLLAGEYGGTGRDRRHQKVQDLAPRKSRGCDLAFRNPVNIKRHAVLTNGAEATVSLRVASVSAFIVMKAFAMRGRRRPKDPYDLVYCLRYYPGGTAPVVRDFDGLNRHGLVREAVEILAEDFQSMNHVGPTDYANYQGLPAGEEREQARRVAFELVQALIAGLRSDPV